MIKITATEIRDVKIIQPRVYRDERGYFFESYNKKHLQEALGITEEFVQDNHSHSKKHCLRGLHYQADHPQGKLVRVMKGEVFDVIADIRKDSPTYGKWIGMTLSEDLCQLVWIPSGLAHGFLVLSEEADFLYKTTDYYHPESERCIIWNDPTLAIDWPIEGSPVLSAKDQQGELFRR